MTCGNYTAAFWRKEGQGFTDELVANELSRAWMGSFKGPPYNRTHHDWAYFRAATLREARRRGLDLSAAGLRT